MAAARSSGSRQAPAPARTTTRQPAARQPAAAPARGRQTPPAAVAPAANRRGAAATSAAAGNRQPPLRQAPAPAAPAGRGRGRAGAGGAGDVNSLLAGMKSSWNTAKEQSKSSGDFSINLPSDTYVGQLVEGKVFPFGKKQCALTLTFAVLEGEYTGESIPFFYELTDAEKLVWAQRDLRAIGSEIDSLEPEDIPAEVESLLANPPEVRIFVKPPNAQGFINAKIKGLVNADGGGEATDLNAGTDPNDAGAGESQLDLNADPGDGQDMGDPIEGDAIEWKDGRAKKTGVVDSVDLNAGTVVATEDRSQQQVTLNIGEFEILPPEPTT